MLDANKTDIPVVRRALEVVKLPFKSGTLGPATPADNVVPPIIIIMNAKNMKKVNDDISRLDTGVPGG